MAYTPTKPKSTGASGKYPTYQKGTSTPAGKATPTPTYYNPETRQVSTSPGVIIEAPTQILRDNQGNPILNPQGETISIQEVREAEIKKAATEGQRLTETQKTQLINAQLIKQQTPKQKVEIALDYESVNEINRQFRAAGYKNAGELIEGIKKGETKILGNKYPLILTTKTTTKGETLTEEDKKELEKEYFGAEQYFKKIAKEGVTELKEGFTYNEEDNTIRKRIKSRFIPAITGTTKLLYGITGAGFSSVTEKAAYLLTTRKKTPVSYGKYTYNPNAYSETNYYAEKLKTKKEAYEQAAGVEQLSYIGVLITPKITPRIKTEMYELKLKETETKGIPAFEEYLLGKTYRKPEITSPYSINFGTQTPSNIKGGGAPDPFGLIKIEKPSTKYNVIIKTTPEGKPVLTIIETKPAELQSQIYPTEGEIVTGRYGTESPIPTKSFDFKTLFSPDIAEKGEISDITKRIYNPITGELKIIEGKLPNIREVTEVLNKKYQLTLPGTNPEPPPPGITKEEIFKIFREENPATTNKRLTEIFPEMAKEAPPTEYESININNNVFTYNPETKKLIFLGKKGQTSLSFGESAIIKEEGITKENRIQPGGNYFAGIKRGGELTGGKIAPPPSEIIKPGQEFTPIAINPFLPGGQKPITELNIKSYEFTENKSKLFSANIPTGIIKPDFKTGIKSSFKTYSAPDTSSRIKPILKTAQIQTQAQETIQETKQEVTTIPVNDYIRITTTTPKNIYDITPPKTPPQTPPPPLKFSRFKKTIGTTGYNVFIKTRSGFMKINPATLSRQEAINFGAYRTETTPKASFKIARSQQAATGSFTGKVNLQNFYTRKGVFIEKPSARINTIGELQGITYKGLSIKRQKPNKKVSRRRNIWAL